ncbi:hypothetical protein Q7P37_010055 [Cladosporium fusiforme]
MMMGGGVAFGGTQAFKEANPDCVPTEANKHAKSEEATARKNALTLAEYHQLCAKSIGLLIASTRTGSLIDQHPDEHVAPNLPEHGAQIGRYTNANHWKDGLFSDIFQAKDPESDKVVALKVTTPSMMTAPHDSVREARILTATKGPSIIELTETFTQQGDRFVLVFPFMPYDLGTMLQRNIPPATIRKSVLRDIFTGLSHLHALGIIHRDIKPSNILLPTLQGPAYIADFGIAWSGSDSASESADAKHLEVGTTSYRPPELLFGKQDYGTKLDMWSAGCVAAQVLCLGNRTLFDSGDLGSELALIKSIFETLGTPDLEVWPEAATLPDWGKMKFTTYPSKPWSEILSGLQPEEFDLVRDLVVYESKNRLTADQALRHHYFEEKT